MQHTSNQENLIAASVTLLLAGATGLVGRHTLSLALADPRVAGVVALTRRALPPHPKLTAIVVDFDRLDGQAPYWQADAVICTLGTTMRVAGSQDAFRRVDYTYPLAVARLAREHGTPACVLNSAAGAETGSRFFYNRVKGELERDLSAQSFTSLTFVRPGLIGGKREQFRLGERVLETVLAVVGPLLPTAWRINPAPRIARALLDAAIDPQAGQHVVAAAQLA